MSITAVQILEALEDLGNNQLCIREMRLGSGFGRTSEGRMDLWTLCTAKSRGFVATGYEVKISRSDFLRDIRQPFKHKTALLFTNYFWFVAPEGVVDYRELPPWAGLMEAYRCDDCLCLKQTHDAVYRDKMPPSWSFVVSLVRRLQ